MKTESRLKILFVIALNLFAIMEVFGDLNSTEKISHPRLYFSAQDLPQLRKLRGERIHAKIYKNLIESADWCLTKTPRAQWIAPLQSASQRECICFVSRLSQFAPARPGDHKQKSNEVRRRVRLQSGLQKTFDESDDASRHRASI